MIFLPPLISYGGLLAGLGGTYLPLRVEVQLSVTFLCIILLRKFSAARSGASEPRLCSGMTSIGRSIEILSLYSKKKAVKQRRPMLYHVTSCRALNVMSCR